MAVVHASSGRQQSGVGTGRRFFGVAVLLVAAGAAAFIWWGRLAADRNEDVVAYVEMLASSSTPGSGEGVMEAAARTTLAAVTRNAGAAVFIRLKEGDVPEGDGRATHTAVVTSDVGDEIILRIVRDSGGKCRLLGVIGEPEPNPNDALQRRTNRAPVPPPSAGVE